MSSFSCSALSFPTQTHTCARCANQPSQRVVTSASCASENGALSSHDFNMISWTDSKLLEASSLSPSSEIHVSTYDGYTWLLSPSIVTLGLGTLFLSRKHSPNVTPPDSGNWRVIGNDVHLHRFKRPEARLSISPCPPFSPFLVCSISHSILYHYALKICL